ncbi:MAG TPA: RMD1 family protein [Xanthobacteraceae bacterium]|nr:RMD1 family protein [Xanthobacteraceae bacterium]
MADQKTIRALLVGDRIDTSGLERRDVLSTNPLGFRAGQDGVVTLFRYGVAVLIGMSPLEEDEVLRSLQSRIVGPLQKREEEIAIVEIAPDKDEQIPPGGPIVLKALTPEHMVLIADALAKSVVLAKDERDVSTVLDVTEPFARRLSEDGRTPGGRRAMLRLIGRALLVRHRVSGRVAIAEKPDVLWDRPDLERLYARLEDEYELQERADTLSRKLAVIAETAKALTDIIDTKRSLRLEQTIVLLILLEIVLAAYQMLVR